MRQTKYQFHLFSRTDVVRIQKYLEKQALKGWMLEEIGEYFWKYRRIEPRSLRFEVTYFADASDYDPIPSRAQQSYIDWCAEAGWKHFLSSRKLQFFYHEEEHPLPIETDALTKVRNIHKATKESLKGYGFMLGFCLLNLGLVGWLCFRDPLKVLSDYFMVFAGVLFFGGAIIAIVDSAEFCLWYRKAIKVATETGRFWEGWDRRWLDRLYLAFLFVLIFLWGYLPAGWLGVLYSIVRWGLFFGIYALLNAMTRGLRKQGVDAKENKGITTMAFVLLFAFFHTFVPYAHEMFETSKTVEYPYVKGVYYTAYMDDLPLELGDFYEVDVNEYSRKLDLHETIWVTDLKAWQDPRRGFDGSELYYRVLGSSIPMFYEKIRNDFFVIYDGRYGYTLDPMNGLFAGAIAAYQVKLETPDGSWNYLFEWDDYLLYISFDWEPTMEQLLVAIDKIVERQGGT